MKKLFLTLMLLMLSMTMISCVGNDTTTISNDNSSESEPLSQDDILSSLSSAIKDLFD